MWKTHHVYHFPTETHGFSTSTWDAMALPPLSPEAPHSCGQRLEPGGTNEFHANNIKYTNINNIHMIICYIYIIYILYIFWLIYICSHMWHMWSYVYHVTWLPYEVMDQRGSFYASLVASHCVFQSQRGQGLPIKGLSMTRTLKVLPGSPGEVGQFSKRIAPPENILNIIKHNSGVSRV